MKKLVPTIIVLLIVVAALLILGPFYILQEGQMAVLTRFGKIVEVNEEPGLSFKMPVVDNVVKYTSKLLTWNGDAQRIPTKENQFIWVDATARWRISDPIRFYESVNTIQGGIARLNDILDSTIRTVISENYLNEAVRSTNRINEMKVEENIGEVESEEDRETLRSLTETDTKQNEIYIGRDRLSNMMLQTAAPLTEVYGIELEDIIIRQIRYSDDLTASVFDRMIKERNQIAEAYRSYGRGQLSYWQGRTENDKMRILSEAYAKSEEIKGNADKEATRIYSEAYRKNEEFFRLWTELESYKEVLGGVEKILSTDLEYFDYIYSKDGKNAK